MQTWKQYYLMATGVLTLGYTSGEKRLMSFSHSPFKDEAQTVLCKDPVRTAQ